jgi:hypothetical protein
LTTPCADAHNKLMKNVSIGEGRGLRCWQR